MLLLNLFIKFPPKLRINFNTSYVVIKHIKSRPIARNDLISIHLMLLLNVEWVILGHSERRHFNTSYVVIKH